MRSLDPPLRLLRAMCAVLGLLLFLGIGHLCGWMGDGLLSAAGQSSALGARPNDVAASTALEVQVNSTDGAGTLRVLVELEQAPAVVSYALAADPTGEREPSSADAAIAAGASQLAVVASEQERVAAAIEDAGIPARKIYHLRRAMNGIAYEIDASSLDALRRIAGVRKVTILQPEHPTNSSSVPFLGAPSVWAGGGGLASRATGAGVRIGIIDSGIDYQHADFGGTGTLSDYQSNIRTTIGDGYFPTQKVVGGWDFAGDDYTGSNTPVPDPDPMDCNGHGTHVAATVAGYGVNADGTTYMGTYGSAAPVPFSSLRIGPGVAPEASLYALRVFGCTGTTYLVPQAIEWATDPNGDGDFSDRLDVINLSLGSSSGRLSDSTAKAAENAAKIGVTVVAAAGDSGDTYFFGGGPGSSPRALSVAASQDDGTFGAGVRVNAPAGIAKTYPAQTPAFGIPPPAGGLTADVVIGLDTADSFGPLTTDACSALTNPAEVAGKIALIDRGTCGFSVKVKNAQNAGAVGVIVANSATGTWGGMGGADASVVIPSLMVTYADGNTLKANIATLNATLPSGADTIASATARGPALSSPVTLKPDIAAPGISISSAQTGVTCTSGACLTPNGTGYLQGSQAVTLSGTSMASAHVAGVMALLRQLHPAWSAEELKALAMNGATHDLQVLPGTDEAGKYGAGRAGAGRVDVLNSASLPVVAFNADGSGTVSVAFETKEVLGTATETQRIKVVNPGNAPVTYSIAVDTSLDAPGIAFSLPGESAITVAAQQSVVVDVQMTADASLMTHTREASVAATQAATAPLSGLGNLARHWLTEETGSVTFSSGGGVRLRVPLYASARPASLMAAPPTITTGGAPTGSTTLSLSGTGVCTGTASSGSCAGTWPTDEVSLLTPFELQMRHPRVTGVPDYANVRYGGVAYDPTSNLVMFGVSTWGEWRTPTDVSFNIYIDANNDGTWDRVVFNSSPGAMSGALFGQSGYYPQDVFTTSVINLSTYGVSLGGNGLYVNGRSPATVDSALFNSDVMFLGATPSQLGLVAAGTTGFRYKIQTCPGSAPLCGVLNGYHYDEVGTDAQPFTWNYVAQGLNFGGGYLVFDVDGNTIPVDWNAANLAANRSLGALLLHHHNTAGSRAQVVLMEGTPSADLAITGSASPASPELNGVVAVTLNIVNSGPEAASNVEVLFTPTPSDGVTCPADDSGGSFDSFTGVWKIARIDAAGSAALHLSCVMKTTDPVRLAAQIIASAPQDGDAANDQAVIDLAAPRLADVATTSSVTPLVSALGTALTFKITLANPGPDTAYDVVVGNVFSSSSYISAAGSASRGAFDLSSLTWRLSSLEPGGSAMLTLNATPLQPGVFTLTSTATSAGDANGSNNTATASAALRSSPPVVASITPASGSTLGGTQVTIGGANFTPGATVTIGGVSASIGTIEATAITATTPAHAAGAVDVVVSNPDAQSGTLRDGYTYVSQTREYYLAEGATVWNFDTSIAIANPGAIDAPVTLSFHKDDGTTVQTNLTVAAGTRDTVRVLDVPGMSGVSFATTVTSTEGVPLAVERTMTWDGGHGAHTGTAADSASTSWYFAEGTQGSFDTYLLVNNPGDASGDVTFTFYTQVGAPVTRTATVPGHSRFTLYAGSVPELSWTSFATRITSSVAVVAERAVYFGAARRWDGGTVTLGMTAPSTSWYFAEGATGATFDLYLPIANPNADTANVTVTYLLADGTTEVHNYAIAGERRATIWVNGESEKLKWADGLSVKMTADRPVLAERVLYWPAPFASWRDGHASTGAAAVGTRWALAEGRVGGSDNCQTYLTIGNPGDTASEVRVTFLRAPGRSAVVGNYTVNPTSRLTVWTNQVAAELADERFGMLVEVTTGGGVVVERSMYWDASGVPWAAGTGSLGVRIE